MEFSIVLMFAASVFINGQVLTSEFEVKTINYNITGPTGIDRGYYQGNSGCFIASVEQSSIYFIRDGFEDFTLVAGIPFQPGSKDGQMKYATFAAPLRIAYDKTYDRLFIIEKQSGYLRIINLKSDQVETLMTPADPTTSTSSYSKHSFMPSYQTEIMFPLYDIKVSSSSIIYLTNSDSVFSISLNHNSLEYYMVNTSATSDLYYIYTYNNVQNYFISHNYPMNDLVSRCYIYSISPDSSRDVLYISVAYAINVILSVPLSQDGSVDDIFVLLGNEQFVYLGNFMHVDVPYSKNGNIYQEYTASMQTGGDKIDMAPDAVPLSLSEYDYDNGIKTSPTTMTQSLDVNPSEIYPDNVYLSFPTFIQLSEDCNTMYILEGYPTTSDYLHMFGSLSVKRFDFISGELDSYAGKDMTVASNSTEIFLGMPGGFADGPLNASLFAYPLSLTIIDEVTTHTTRNQHLSDAKHSSVFHEMYICDFSNHAIRAVSSSLASPHSHSPTEIPNMPPSLSPSPWHGSNETENISEMSQRDILYYTLVALFSIFSVVLLCILGQLFVSYLHDKDAGSIESKSNPAVSSTSSLSSSCYVLLFPLYTCLYYASCGYCCALYTYNSLDSTSNHHSGHSHNSQSSKGSLQEIDLYTPFEIGGSNSCESESNIHSVDVLNTAPSSTTPSPPSTSPTPFTFLSQIVQFFSFAAHLHSTRENSSHNHHIEVSPNISQSPIAAESDIMKVEEGDNTVRSAGNGNGKSLAWSSIAPGGIRKPTTRR